MLTRMALGGLVLLVSSASGVFASPVSAGGTSDSCPEPREGETASLLQQRISDRHLVSLRHDMAPGAAEAEGSWSADFFSQCTMGCGEGPMQFRQVACKSPYTGEALQDSSCPASQKPGTWRPCSCATDLCVNIAGECPALPAPPEDGNDEEEEGEEKERGLVLKPATWAGEAAFEEVGCFAAPVSAWSNEAGSIVSKYSYGYYDYSCMAFNSTQGELCQQGLAFYKYVKEGTIFDPEECFKFCLGKAMDVFGITDNSHACRCGATALNRQIWYNAKPRAGLAFSPGAAEAAEGKACPLRVFRYVGPFEGHTIPSANLTMNVDDTEYIPSIVAGRKIAWEDPVVEDDIVPDLADALAPMTQAGSWRDCSNNGHCAPYQDGPWRKKRVPGGAGDEWRELVYIPYIFNSTNNALADALGEAKKMWTSTTCVRFEQRALVPTPEKPYFIVDEPHFIVNDWNKDGCYVIWRGEPDDKACPFASSGPEYEIGFCETGGAPPRRHFPSKVMLGWCNETIYKGDIAHELGHMLGMNHEQKRPDANEKWQDPDGKSHGPWIKVYWDNLKKDGKNQYMPDVDSYTGSVDVGYADYDFDSIMHYPKKGFAVGAGNAFDLADGVTLPPGVGDVGQRNHLSKGDIQQMNDMYQC